MPKRILNYQEIKMEYEKLLKDKSEVIELKKIIEHKKKIIKELKRENRDFGYLLYQKINKR